MMMKNVRILVAAAACVLLGMPLLAEEPVPVIQGMGVEAGPSGPVLRIRAPIRSMMTTKPDRAFNSKRLLRYACQGMALAGEGAANLHGAGLVDITHTDKGLAFLRHLGSGRL